MDIDDLKILNAVARNGSMNRAASELHMVQSNVTARVRQIEEELGKPLFVRHSRGVTLNEAGQRLLAYSGRIDALFHEAVAAVKDDGVPSGALRIGALEQTLSARLPDVLEEYTVAFPDVALTITTDNSSDLIAQVLDGELDGAFVRGPVNRPGLNAETLFVEELVLVTGRAVERMQQLQASEVKAFVLAQGCSYRELLGGILDSCGVRHQVQAVASFEVIRTLVQSNVGVTLLPKEFLTNAWRGALVSVHELPRGLVAETAFITRTGQAPSSALTAFLSVTRKAANASR